MHPNSSFRWDDPIELRQFAQAIGFGMVFAGTPDGPRVVHTPFVFTGDQTITFHIARGNGITKHLAKSEALLVINGPDAYISPDWYGMDDQVPTWNYLSAELQGTIRTLSTEELIAQVDALTAQHEQGLAPKTAWTRTLLSKGRFEKLVSGIVGFELSVTGWRGTRKLGQDKPSEAQARVAAALEANGQRAMAQLMTRLSQEPSR